MRNDNSFEYRLDISVIAKLHRDRIARFEQISVTLLEVAVRSRPIEEHHFRRSDLVERFSYYDLGYLYLTTYCLTIDEDGQTGYISRNCSARCKAIETH